MIRKTRPVSWIKSALKEFEAFPEGAKSICLVALTIAAEGSRIPEKIDAGDQNGATRYRFNQGTFEENEGDAAMKNEPLDIVRGSGNVFRDLGHKNGDAQQLKSILAAEIIKTLDRETLTLRAAHERTGVAAADFSRIRNAELGRFTVDRLIMILNRFGSRVDIKIRIRKNAA